jgi:hypothetical protein
MKTKFDMNSLLLGAFAGAVMVLCVVAATTKTNAAVSPAIPAAQSYAVQIGHSEYHAKSVKIDGDWISFETHGPQGSTTIFAPCSAVRFIEPHQAK